MGLLMIEVRSAIIVELMRAVYISTLYILSEA